MPNLHDIERRINSISSTKQITRTMEMVSAAKIRKSTERVDAATPYSNSMTEMLSSVASRVQGGQSALLSKHEEIKSVLVVVVVSDRGLAGGFNSNVLRRAEAVMREKQAEGASCQVVACGKKALSYFKYRNIKPVLEYIDLSADPTVEEASGVATFAIDGYVKNEIDEVVLVYNHAKNAAEQVLTTETVLPVDPERFAATDTSDKDSSVPGAEQASDAAIPGDVEFEPSAEGVLDKLLPAYVRTTIFHGLVDSAAAEQAARRAAMKSATDNAIEMVETLTRLYNRVRQGAITTEITEIVGGAAALEE